MTSNQTIPVAIQNYIGCMDVGNFIDKLNLDPYTKYSILRNHWIPPPNYEYPWSEHIRAGTTKKRKPSKKHLDNYTWLVLSDVCKGLFCKYCFLFAPTNVSNVELKTLVKSHCLISLNLLEKMDILKFIIVTSITVMHLNQANSFCWLMKIQIKVS